MAHTLNEQIIRIPAGTGNDNIELILNAAAGLTGWYRDGYTLYADSAHTMGVRFRWTAGSTSCRVEGFFNNNTVIEYYSSFGVAAGATIRAHKSTDETVTYLNLGNPYLRFIHTVNENGDDLLLQTYGNDDVYAGTPSLSSPADIKLPYYTTGKKYCITKFPDPVNGAGISSLYMVVGTASPSLHNQLVSFDGDIYRIAFFGGNENTNMPALAFPVSDEQEDE